MDFISFKECIIARCEKLGIQEYELYYQALESTSVSAYQQQINEFTGSTEGGVCFRCIVGGKMGYASTEELSAEQAQQLVDRALDNAANLETDDPVFLGQGGQRYEPLDHQGIPLPTTEGLVKVEGQADYHGKYCSVCQSYVSVAEHNWQEGETVASPMPCLTPGLQKYQCADCAGRISDHCRYGFQSLQHKT